MRLSYWFFAPLFTLTTIAARADDTGPVVTLSGFVDSSLSYTFTPKALADQGLVIGLDQVELDIDVAAGGSLQLRVDLEFLPSAMLNAADGPVAMYDRIVEQAYGVYTIGQSEWFVRAGKWNAPIGFEVIDPTGLWQWSHGLLFSLATPANLTGVSFGWAGESTAVQLWVSNDWDEPATYKHASLGGRFQQALGAAGAIGVSATFGKLAEADPKLMLDVDLTLGFGDFKLGAEFNFGSQGDASSIGALIALNYAFTDAFSMTLRGDYLDREIIGSQYKGASATLAGLLNLTQGFDLIAELRADFPDGDDTAVLGALELLASF